MAFSFGSNTTTTTANPFAFGAKTTAASLTFSTPASTATSGFNFGLAKTTASTGLLATPASTATASTGSFGFGTGSPFTGTGLGAAATTTSSGGFGGFGLAKTTAATSSFGFGSGGGLTTGLLGTTPASSTTTGLGGGLFGTPSTAATTGGSSIFTSQAAKTTTVGLGGVDPNAGIKSGASGTSGSTSDGRTLKESILPDQLTATVDALQKYVKEEKAVREDIARISSKPMTKVQEDVMALKQLLSVVANGLQRNTCSVEKLKQEMTQNLKNAEMAQRTKDLPAGLQYENTAPTEYFQRLVKDFEDGMVMYRQQIETLDNHLAALHQPSPHSPADEESRPDANKKWDPFDVDIDDPFDVDKYRTRSRSTSNSVNAANYEDSRDSSNDSCGVMDYDDSDDCVPECEGASLLQRAVQSKTNHEIPKTVEVQPTHVDVSVGEGEVLSLMKKLHETFLSLAAMLQQVHDAVTVQKDQFLTYRRVFHEDTRDIFQKTQITQKPVRRKQLSDMAGPNPFPGVSNAATQAMAMVLNRSQQPQGPPATSLVGVSQLGSNPFPSGGLFSSNKPLSGFGTPQTGGIGGSGSLFSSTFGASPSVGGFGTPPTLGSSTTAALNLAGTNLNMSAGPKQPFQLQKPPPGAKRGKR